METTKIDFAYILEDSSVYHKQFPYRVGDIVKILDWGMVYPSYTDAFKEFGINGNDKFNFFERKSPFKIIDIKQHGNDRNVVCHLRDRNFKNVVVDIEGLYPLKIYPLRIGETNKVLIKKIKH